MSDKNLYVRIGLIVLIVTLAAWEIWPPGERLKGGIDLVGGTSLLYEIDTSGLKTGERTDLAERVMGRLKNRVDPKGQRNLVWRPIGQNRLEIQMPRPPAELQARREKYEAARGALRATQVDRNEIEAALALSGTARDEAFAALVRSVPERVELFKEFIELKVKLDTAAASAEPVDFDVDAVREAYLGAVDRILETNIHLDRLGDTLSLDKGNPDREKELAAVRAGHPNRVALIDALIAAHDQWAEQKGPLEDASDLMRLLRGQGVLEFRILAEPDPANPQKLLAKNPAQQEPIEKYTTQLTERGPRRRAEDNYLWFRVAKPDEFEPAGNPIIQEYMGAQYVLAHATPDMGLLHDGTWSLRSARPDRDQQNRWAVSFLLDAAGGSRFERLTDTNIGRPLCILLDGEAQSAPNIRSAIREQGQISGEFTQEEVFVLCNTLEAGSLDARLKDTPLSIKTIGPSLGEANRRLGLQACITALIIVVAFMAVYYMYAGVIADIALILNLVITLGIMAMIQGTFTLQGIAGLILTLGMAVDANVLIFERIREEQARGVSLRMAVKLGYEKAFWTIFDANLTSIIAAVILGYIGSEEVKGFALTLGLGLCVSMFTALFVTRQFFTVMVQHRVTRLESARCWGGTLVLGVLGGALFGLGWLLHAPETRAKSNAVGLGEFLFVAFATALILMVLIWGMRWLAISTGAHRTNRIPMLHLLRPPKIDWMAKQKYFWTVSGVMTIGGVLLFALQPAEVLLDIEFLGGTSAQITLEPKNEPVTDAEIEAIVKGESDPGQVGGWLHEAARQLEAATVLAGDTPGTFVVQSGNLTASQLAALLQGSVGDRIEKGGVEPVPGGITVRMMPTIIEGEDNTAPQRVDVTLDAFKASVTKAAALARDAAANFKTSARVQSIEEYEATTAAGKTAQAFEIVTIETNKTLVGEAILAALMQHGERFTVKVERPIGFELVHDPNLVPEGATEGAFPILGAHRELGDVIGEPAPFNILRYKGGVAMVFADLTPPQPTEEIQKRLREMRLQPDYEQYDWRESEVFGLTATGETVPGPGEKALPTYSKVAVVVTDENLPYDENRDAWASDLAGPEIELAEAALGSERSLDKVTQFAPQVASQAGRQAIIAMILAFIAMVAYLWFRFGTMEFGLGAILALIHDVAITLGLVTATHWIAGTFLGNLLNITEMRIDLALVAAFLTIVGYSVNDTIVVFDRIRENRGRLATVSPQLINAAINQTLPRSILTSLTTLLVVVVLYAIGGPGVHAFAFALIIGVASGTYSSIAIASPILYRPAAMRVMLAIVVLALSAGLMIGGKTHTERVIMGIVAALILVLLGLWHVRRRSEEAKIRVA
ncbi:MAG: protein translocase subunit SecD [Phycisphaerae bacterium]|nr:protein translocase subunit SecD [Phycisphaerae bacterium]